MANIEKNLKKSFARVRQDMLRLQTELLKMQANQVRAVKELEDKINQISSKTSNKKKR